MSERTRTGRMAAPAGAPSTAAKDAGEFRIEAWMSRPALTIKPRDTVAHARALLEENRVNQLPVVIDGKLVGIVTDRDLRDAAGAVEASARAAGAHPDREEVRPEHLAVESVMTSKVLALAPSDRIERAAALMRRERIGAIPVVARGRLVGIVARSDVLDAFIALVRRLRPAA